jgi:hypothetical protein
MGEGPEARSWGHGKGIDIEIGEGDLEPAARMAA